MSRRELVTAVIVPAVLGLALFALLRAHAVKEVEIEVQGMT